MRANAKLGTLVVSDERRPSRAPSARALLSAVLTAVVATLVLAAAAWYWLGTPPRKLVVRGSSMLAAPELIATMGINHIDPAWAVWNKCRKFNGEGTRWIGGARCRPLPGRALLIEIAERKPLLRVVSGEAKLWLCQDGWLMRMDVDADHGGIFDRIRQLPSVRLPAAEPDTQLPEADSILQAAAACYAALPGEIDLIELGTDGELSLYDKTGFPIKLGKPTMLNAKISALPKALRICSENRDKLLYLDASNPAVFYEKWKEPQVKAGT